MTRYSPPSHIDLSCNISFGAIIGGVTGSGIAFVFLRRAFRSRCIDHPEVKDMNKEWKMVIFILSRFDHVLEEIDKAIIKNVCICTVINVWVRVEKEAKYYFGSYYKVSRFFFFYLFVNEFYVLAIILVKR